MRRAWLGWLACLWLVLAAACAQRAGGSPPAQRVEAVSADPQRAVAFLEALGAHIELRSHDRIQAVVPAAAMPAVAQAGDVLRVEPPAVAVPLEVGNAVQLVGAGTWQGAGFTGHGVRVAVLDAGFNGWDRRLGASLPVRVRARSFRADSDLAAGTDHGTRAAEVVYAVAPGVELYLLNFSTLTEMSAAVDYLVAERVDIVSFSLGFVHNGPGDGTGDVDDIVSRALAGGALWTVAAGNWAQQHWSGTFIDTNGDSIHEFAPGVTLNGRAYRTGDLIIVSLRWNDVWGAACSDYDLELFGPDGALVRASRALQDCRGDPAEGIQVLATRDGTYSARVVRAFDDRPRRVDLLMVGSPGRTEVLDRFVTAGSLSEPADHPGVIAVGALTTVPSLSLEPFSSRGPTLDGRPKPEITSPTGLPNAVARGEAFAGTSAAAPYVAGVAAMLKEAFPRDTRAQLTAEVAQRALRFSPGESGTGRGMAFLGALDGLGPLLPAGAALAQIRGSYPPGAGLGLLLYTGPDGYPVRFAHLLTGEHLPVAWARFDVQRQRWESYIVGAPPQVNSGFATMNGGTVLAGRFAAPAP